MTESPIRRALRQQAEELAQKVITHYRSAQRIADRYNREHPTEPTTTANVIDAFKARAEQSGNLDDLILWTRVESYGIHDRTLKAHRSLKEVDAEVQSFARENPGIEPGIGF